MGYTTSNRFEICSLKPAPVQMSYLGFLGTTGADFIDYIITDKIVTPEEHSSFYSENFVYMPHCFQINDNQQKISNHIWEKKDVGLPEKSFVFCSFNQGYKIEATVFNSWIHILKNVTDSVIWLLKADDLMTHNLKQSAEEKGVDPSRLIFANSIPIADHLARLKLADLALDTWTYNGGATTSNALWAGIPLITLMGNHFVSRMSSSSLTGVGLTELITYSPKEYETLAIKLATHPEKLFNIKNKLLKNRTTKPYFDTKRFVMNLEQGYKEVWNRFITSNTPRRVTITEPTI